MKIFGKTADPIGELNTSLERLRKRRDFLAARLEESARAIEKARASRKAALDGEDGAAFSKCGAALLQAEELACLLETEIDDCARQISNAETELSLVQDRAAREAKAARLEKAAENIGPAHDAYIEASNMYVDALAPLEGIFEADTRVAYVKKTASEIGGGLPMLRCETDARIAELRREPAPRAPAPQLPPGVLPRGTLWRNDPHPHPMSRT